MDDLERQRLVRMADRITIGARGGTIFMPCDAYEEIRLDALAEGLDAHPPLMELPVVRVIDNDEDTLGAYVRISGGVAVRVITGPGPELVAPAPRPAEGR